jgi:hypothetical protein
MPKKCLSAVKVRTYTFKKYRESKPGALKQFLNKFRDRVRGDSQQVQWQGQLHQIQKI